jgi:hypothetical protein
MMTILYIGIPAAAMVYLSCRENENPVSNRNRAGVYALIEFKARDINLALRPILQEFLELA